MKAAPGDRLLFDSEFLRKLEFLTLVSRRMHRGDSRGEHATFRKGTSLEFFDYRNYQPGDDFRYIDWNVFSRIDRLLVKLYRAEEDLSVHLLVDTSESMRFGNPSKIDYARKVGVALGIVGILNLDRVGVTAFADGLREYLSPHRSKRRIFSLFDYFSRIQVRGGTSLNRSLVDYSVRCKRPGLAIVLSDLLDADGYEKGLLSLLYRRFDVVVIHIVAEEELEPSVKGAFRLVDSETGEVRRVTVDEDFVRSYRRVVQDFFRGSEEFCLRHGVEYMRASTIIPFEDLILKYLRQGIHLK